MRKNIGMKKNIRVEVTQEDIDTGVRNSSRECMFAKAARRAIAADGARLISQLRTATIGEYEYKAEDGKVVTLSAYWGLTQTATRRIRQFDRGETVKPFVTIIRGI